MPFVEIIQEAVLQKIGNEPPLIDFERDIKSAKSSGGKDVFQILFYPISNLLDQLAEERPKGTIIGIDKPFPVASTATKQKHFVFTKDLAAGKPSYARFTSTVAMVDVQTCWDQYAEALTGIQVRAQIRATF